MTWAHWVLILVPPAYAGFMWWIVRGPLAIGDEYCGCPDWCDCDDCHEAARLDVMLEQPVREACALDVCEEVAWQQITQGEER